MPSSSAIIWRIEAIWVIITLIICTLILGPILYRLPDYPFLNWNLLFLVVTITATRYLFLLKDTFIAKRNAVKVVLFFCCIPFVFFLIQGVNHFQNYLDENSISAIVGSLPFAEQKGMMRYIRNEMIFFGTAAVITTGLLAVRLIVSVWLWKNRKTV